MRRFAKLTVHEEQRLKNVGATAGHIYHAMKFAVLYKGEYAGLVRVSQQQLAGKIGCSDRSIRTGVAQLKAAGLVEVVRSTGRSCFYFLSLDQESVKLVTDKPALFLAARKPDRNLGSYQLGNLVPSRTVSSFDVSRLSLSGGEPPPSDFGADTPAGATQTTPLSAQPSDHEIRSLAAHDRAEVTAHMDALKAWESSPDIPTPQHAAFDAHRAGCESCQAADSPNAMQRVFCATGADLVKDIRTPAHAVRIREHLKSCEPCRDARKVRVVHFCSEGVALESLRSFAKPTMRPPTPSAPQLSEPGQRTLTVMGGYDELRKKSRQWFRKDWNEEFFDQCRFYGEAEIPGEQFSIPQINRKQAS